MTREIPSLPVSALLDRVIAWAARQPSISGVALVGSHARGAARRALRALMILEELRRGRWRRDIPTCTSALFRVAH